MSIAKNEIPILEFDTAQTAVIEPAHEKLELNLPRKCVFAFLGDYIDEYALKNNAQKVGEFVSATKHYPIYIIEYTGEKIVLCQAPVGAAPAAQIMDWLIGYPKARSSCRTRLCVMKEPPTITRLPHVLWKLVRRQEKRLKKL